MECSKICTCQYLYYYYLHSKGERQSWVLADMQKAYGRSREGARPPKPCASGSVIVALSFLSLLDWSAKSRASQSPREHTIFSDKAS